MQLINYPINFYDNEILIKQFINGITIEYMKRFFFRFFFLARSQTLKKEINLIIQ